MLISSLSGMIAYMMIKLNKPLVTRKNLTTGEEVSMLMFVRSKKHMQKIFDPSSEMTSSINTFEEKPNEGDQFYE